MDAFCDPRIEEIILCCASQVGKTEDILNTIGYAIHQDPGPMLVVYPTKELADFVSENRIEPAILSSPELAARYYKAQSDRLELQFSGMYVALGGANSPAQLASRPIRYLLMDEVDKFPRYSRKEANPISLAEERTKNFYNRKIVKASTPTLSSGYVWQAWLRADARKRFHVPCPLCGQYQALDFKQIKWPEGMSSAPEMVREAAWYECRHCGGIIEDRHKGDMLRAGRWLAEGDSKLKFRSVAFHLSSLYSPWITFGEIAYKFLVSKDYPELLMNFVNSWLAEPWEPKASRFRSDVVMEHKAPYKRGTVPRDALLMTAGIDVQLDHFWFVVKAWGEKMASWTVDEGRVETFADLDEILDREYNAEGDAPKLIHLALADSGFRTDEVYQWCSEREGVVLPSKGANQRLTAPCRISKVDRDEWGNLKMVLVDTHYFKDWLAGRLNKGLGEPGSWYVPEDISREYADQLCSEQKVQETDGKGRLLERWQKVSSHARNHLLDAEVGAACAAELAGVRYLKKAELPVEPTKPEIKRKQEGWIKRSGSWIKGG